jgi:simple sugar transport system permease protein
VSGQTETTPTPPTGPAAAPTAPEGPDEGARWRNALHEVASGQAIVGVLAVLLAVITGSLLILLTDENVRTTASYITARPADFFSAVREAISGAYGALFRGAIYNTDATDFTTGIRPLTETLKFAGPLIMAGLGVGLAFRAGLFNIGGRGQMLIGGAAAGWVGSRFDLPPVIHLLLALLAAIVGGALWGGLVGLLKARTGAHEVIVTIMLNYVGFYLVFFALSKQSLLQQEGSINPQSAAMHENAILPKILGDRFNLHLGFIIALLLVALVWWIIERSAFGFRLRAVGLNPEAAKAAGISVGRTYITVMLFAGALVGLAGANQVLGTVTSGVTVDLDAGIGFDAITVALLGRSRPLGILGAGILFGAFKSGGFAMQASQGITVDIVLVVQSLIVLFIAAPPLVRAMFRLPSKEA